jgi:hypothetical protein
MAPSTTSSMLGSRAAVMATRSPSQLSASDVQRMWTLSLRVMVGVIPTLPPPRVPTPARRRNILAIATIHIP